MVMPSACSKVALTLSGSYGAYPIAIRKKVDEFRDQWDARPCPFTKYEYPKLQDESREAVAEFLDVPVSTVVFVPNATTGVNTVLRNIVWNPDGKDEILQLNVIYDACGKTANYVCEMANDLVRTRTIDLTFPIEDADFLSTFKAAIQASRDTGHRPRLAIFDTIVSIPGIRLPFEALTALCRSEQVLSLIDGAHGIGHVDLNLSSLDPDFFVSNCHKWLYTARSCAVFHVPHRNQSMIRSPIPTSHAFVPRENRSNQSVPEDQSSEFVSNFAFLGTNDTLPYLTVPDAIKWRREVCGGEEKIQSYCKNLASKGGARVAEILETVVLDNKEHTLTDCYFANVRLPLSLGGNEGESTTSEKNIVKPRPGVEAAVVDWIQRTLVAEYGTYIQAFFFQGAWWVRLSGQVYLELDDFDWAGRVLREVCGRLVIEFEQANG